MVLIRNYDSYAEVLSLMHAFPVSRWSSEVSIFSSINKKSTNVILLLSYQLGSNKEVVISTLNLSGAVTQQPNSALMETNSKVQTLVFLSFNLWLQAQETL
jgi:hypothetical protein